VTDKVYSSNNEEFNCSEMSDAIDCLYQGDEKLGDIVTIYEGEVFSPNASGYLPDILTAMEEQAYDDCGDFATDWPDLSDTETKEFNEKVGQVVNELFKKFKQTPEFGTVTNVKTLTLKLTDLNDPDGWELINNE